MTRTAALQTLVLATCAVLCSLHSARAENWYERSFWLLHEDHHTIGTAAVGNAADAAQTSRLLSLCKPDLIQIHAKGNPGWTTYPSKIGHTPPKLQGDVLGMWRDVARRDGYHFSAYYNIGRDGEIMRRRPEWNRVAANGKPVDRALCYHSGVAEQYLWPMIEEIIEHYHPDGFWFDGSCFTVQVCYCDKCLSRFDRETGLEAPRSREQPGWSAYKEMQRQIYREFVRDTTRFIHAIDSECLVAVNWAYSVRMPEKPDPGLAYLTGDIGNRVEGLSLEAHWSDAVGLPFDLMTQLNTLQAVARPHDGRRIQTMTPKPVEQIQQEMAVIIANGGRYFAWDSPTAESGLTPERFEFMGRVVSPFLRERQPWCMGTRRLPDVSLLHNAASHYAVNDQKPTCFTRSDRRLDGAAEHLAHLHLNYELVPDWRLEAQDVNSPLLIVEHAKALPKQTIASLLRYAREGGSLLLTGMTPISSGPMRDACGIAAFTGPRGGESLTVDVQDEQISVNHWLFRITPAGCQTLLTARDDQGQQHPLLIKNHFGEGQVFYFATPLLTAHGANVIPDGVMQHVFEQARPAADRLLTTDAPSTVEVVLRSQGDACLLHLVNMAPGHRETLNSGRRRYTKITDIPAVPACHVSIQLADRPKSVRLQPEDIEVENWKYEDGKLECQIPSFAIHQILVMESP